MGQLDAVVAAARTRGDRLGWFGALYGQTTRTVRDEVAAGRFDDAERMRRFVERFAARYMGPLAAWQAGLPVPKSWKVAFRATGAGDAIILQHLLLGINAHVNLDLAVVAAETCPGDEIDGLHDDFMRINDVLGALMPRVPGVHRPLLAPARRDRPPGRGRGRRGPQLQHPGGPRRGVVPGPDPGRRRRPRAPPGARRLPRPRVAVLGKLIATREGCCSGPSTWWRPPSPTTWWPSSTPSPE